MLECVNNDAPHKLYSQRRAEGKSAVRAFYAFSHAYGLAGSPSPISLQVGNCL